MARINEMYQCNEKRMEDKIATFSRYGDAGHGGLRRRPAGSVRVRFCPV